MKGLKVASIDAQKTIRRLKELGLLDLGYKIIREPDGVLIPVKEIPQDIECNFEVVDTNFSEIRKRMRFHECLQEQFPDREFTRSYDQIGHVVIIDVREENLDLKKQIGECMLHSNPSIRSVYRKTDAVSGKFRLRGLELIAGEDAPLTRYKEHGVTMEVDVSKVYLSPRLSNEHLRVAEKIPPYTEVFDMFAGSGIFSLVIAKIKPCTITSLDYNPEGIQCLQNAVRKNKLRGKIRAIHADALNPPVEGPFDIVIMNHPSGANKFLRTAYDLTKDGGRIFFYSFLTSDADELLSQYLAGMDCTIIERHNVRQYAPNEFHACIELEKGTHQFARQISSPQRDP